MGDFEKIFSSKRRFFELKIDHPIQNVIDSYNENVHRINSMRFITPISTAMAMMWGMANEIENKINPTDLSYQEKNDNEKYEQMKNVRNLFADALPHLGKTSPSEYYKYCKRILVDYLPKMPDNEESFLISVVNSTLLITWTTIECLLEDLFYCLDSRDEIQPGITKDVFEKYFEDAYVGSIKTLLNRKDVSFRSLDSIRYVYFRAFPNLSEDLSEILSMRCYDTLSLMRNILVHKAGKTDDKFYEKMARFSDIKIPICEGKLDYDGNFAMDLIDECLDNIERFIELLLPKY